MTTFWNWWLHLPATLDPVLFQVGGFKVQYYGLMYVLAFGLTYCLVLWRCAASRGSISAPPRFRIP
jgi:phosphatidylglycerol:prolipoprotein diacylglycerol transferase